MAGIKQILAMVLLLGTALYTPCAQAENTAVKKSFLNVRSGDDSIFWTGRSLLDPYALTLRNMDAELARCTDLKGLEETYSFSVPEALQYYRYGSLLSFLLRRSGVQDMPSVPIMLSKGDFKERACVLDDNETSLTTHDASALSSEIPGFIMQRYAGSSNPAEELYTGAVQNVPDLGTARDVAALSLGAFPAFLGLASSLQSHKVPAYFDSLITLKDPTCSLTKSGNCAFIFDGDEVKEFYARQKGIGPLTGKIYRDGSVSFDIPHSLMSHDDYVNHGFYTQGELLILRDLGWDVRPLEFIGSEILSVGSPDQRIGSVFNSGFYAYSERTSTYDPSRPSLLPLSCGLHLAGSYNDVEQHSSVVSAGAGSVGVRMDGVANFYTLDKGFSIIENGYDASGIAVTYGQGHVLDLRGRVHAGSAGGVGIKLAFPSNLRSDLNECRGSYFIAHPASLQEDNENTAEELSALSGPLVKDLQISGNVYGKEAGIYIGPSAHVARITLKDGANIEGGIVSKWQPFFKGGAIVISPFENSGVNKEIKLQLDRYLKDPGPYDGFSADSIIRNRLHTQIICGSKADDKQNNIQGDPQAEVRIAGGVHGETLDIINRGGHTRLEGQLNVGTLEIDDGVVSLTTGAQASSINYLRMRNKGVLNLVNGKKDDIAIKRGGYIDEGASLRLDVKPDGSPADDVSFVPLISAKGGYIDVEPGMSYAQIRSLNASPREFMRFIEKFTQGAKILYRDSGLNVSFPRHVWYENGELGMELKCSSRGCRAGRFLSSVADEDEDGGVPLWRYCLSGAGSAVIFFILFLYFSYEKHNGREKRKEIAKKELSVIMKTDEARG